MAEQKERCPVCYLQTTFARGKDTKPCDNCNVPLIAWMPLFKLTESGFMLKLSEDAANKLREFYVEPRESPPDREIRHPLTLEDRRNEVMAMLMVCSNELENKTLFPSLDQTEVALIVKSGSSEIIIKSASFLLQRIYETIEANK